MVEYIPRLIDDEIKKYLKIKGALLIIGPKWCGKTTTAEQFSNSILRLQNPDTLESNLQLADIKPSLLLEGEYPRLIDEWQVIPKLWDSVRTKVDQSSEKGLFILTGSTVVDTSKIMHSGTGRIHRILMRPMSLYEIGDSNGKISLKELFESQLDINGITSDLSLEDLIFTTCRGGWPEVLTIEDKSNQLLIAKDYVENICNNDISNIDNINRDSGKVKLVLQAYSRNISTLVKNSTILKDIVSNYENISEPIFYSYIDALSRLYVLDEVRGWSPNIRSSSAIRKGTKKEFIDPSIAVASLNLSPKKLLYDLNTFGFLFENLCIRDLKIYSSTLGGTIYYYHDRYDLEVDCVLILDDGRYALFEFKLGNREIDKGAKNLLKLKDLIAKKREEGKIHLPDPSFLAIITGGQLAYTRKDGVNVIPIGCLKN